MTNTCFDSWAFTITEPKQGSVFYSGNKVTVRAEPSSGENISSVYFAVPQMGKGTIDFIPPYEFSFNIDADFVGGETIMADAKLSNTTHVQAQVQIIVVLPPNVILQGIEVHPNPVFLYKLSYGSDPNDVRIFEVKSLGVGGKFSDGIQRQITSPTSGTIYTSSNEKVATVSPEGKVTAQGIGTAKITVRNGNYSAQVEVIVDPYKE
jgi:hypothetical protein